MNKREIIERLKNIAEHAVHTVGEPPFVMSLDDGIAVHEAIELLEKLEPLTDNEQAIDYLHKTGWLQNHDRILTESKADAKAEAIPLAWIKGYIVTCDLFDLRVIVPASKVIKTMVKIWEQENPGAKKGGTDAVNN
jgi:hypothetical protein